MDWYANLYTDRKTSKNQRELQHRIDNGDVPAFVYLVTLAVNPDNLAEILSVRELKIKYVREHCPVILGMAYGKISAVRMLTRMINETLEKTGGPDLRTAVEKNLLAGGCGKENRGSAE